MRYRIAILASLLLFFFTVLTGKLAWEQLVNGQKLAWAAVIMRSQAAALKEYPRGDILDRNGVPLTDSSRGYALFITPDLSEARTGPDGTRKTPFAQLLALPEPYLKPDSRTEIKTSINQAISGSQSLLRVASNLDDEEAKALTSLDMEGAMVVPIIKRYRQDGFMAHLLGYVGLRGDNSGQSGIEKNYDQILADAALKPELVSIVDARHAVIPGLAFKLRLDREKPRNLVALTIDKRIQEIVEDSMNRHIPSGAVVVMDIESRDILALASRPAFNPYDNIGAIIADDPNSILTNRALSRYHPGSIFKILVAVAALEEGVIGPGDYFDCTGMYTFNPEVSIPCMKKEGHGHIDLTTAFTHSCNPSFITIGERLGRDALLKYVQRFHLTDETLKGYVDDYDYAYVDIDAGPAALGNASIGQKGVMLTPLQLTSLIATIADGGYWKRPALVRYTVDGKGIKTPAADEAKERIISTQVAQQVCRMMEEAVASGSGRSAAVPEVKIAGKTGTSQTGSMDTSQNPAREILNVWFGGYFPAGSPRFAVMVLVEDGESGSKDAAPVFQDIVRGMMDLFPMPLGADN